MAHHCGPLAYFLMSILVEVTLEDMKKLFYFITFIPKCHILVIRCKKCGILTIFGHVLAILKDFLSELERKNKTKKLHMTLEDMVKFFIS